MKYVSKKFVLRVSKIILSFLLFIAFNHNLQAQEDKDWSLSGAITYGFAPKLSIDGFEDDKNGQLLIFSGDLSYKKFIGRLQYTTILNESTTRIAFHGSLGVNVALADKLYVPVMLSGGGAIVTYRLFSDSFTEGSPQIGVTVAPYYQITKHLAIQSIFRYHKGFKTNDDQRPVDLTDLSIGLRLTL